MQYSNEVMRNIADPKNAGTLEDADGVGRVGNPECDDVTTMYIKVKDDVISDIKFQTLGCGAAIASGSMVTQMVKGMKLEDAANLTKEEVAEKLGGLPDKKMHCSNMAADALKAAIDDYLNKSS